MGRFRRSTTVALIICLISVPGSALFAADNPSVSIHVSAQTAASDIAAPANPLGRPHLIVTDRAVSASLFSSPGGDVLPLSDREIYAQRGYRSRGGGSRDAALAFLAAGALVSITGAAVLVYANRPECKNVSANGCGYGTRVVGGAILSAGMVGMVAGAVAWR